MSFLRRSFRYSLRLAAVKSLRLFWISRFAHSHLLMLPFACAHHLEVICFSLWVLFCWMLFRMCSLLCKFLPWVSVSGIVFWFRDRIQIWAFWCSHNWSSSKSHMVHLGLVVFRVCTPVLWLPFKKCFGRSLSCIDVNMFVCAVFARLVVVCLSVPSFVYLFARC